jgi:chaperonin GroES
MELKAKFKLDALQDSENINELLLEEDSKTIGKHVVSTFDIDKTSRKDWERKMKDAEELALQITEPKNYPFKKASNVKFPLLTIAAMQFAARAYTALVKAPDLVKFRVQGQDENGQKAARADRISTHMSYQLLEEDEVWEEDQDKALMAVPILGCAFKKSYYDKTKGHNCSILALPKNLVVHYYAKSIESAERKTEIIQLSPRKIKERQLRGIFSTFDLPVESVQEPKDTDKRQGITAPPQDLDSPRTLLEWHGFLDLDGDGYKEPYVVTVHKDTGKVYRIKSRFEKVATEQSVEIEETQKRIQSLAEGLEQPEEPTAEDLANIQRAESTILDMQIKIEFLAQQKPKVIKIDPVEYYTKIPFIPSPDGGFYDLGFGVLLGPLNDSVNTLINLLIDAGKWANSNTGFIGRGARIPGGKLRFELNELKRVNVTGGTLRDSIVMMDFKEPSAVLFSLLGLLITYSERIGSVTDANMGENPGQNTPAYNMNAMLEQGQKVYGGIFKRVYRSMRSEFRKLYKLNGLYLDKEEYFSYHDSDSKILAADYTADPKDLIPAADPNAFSSKEKMDKSSMVLERADKVPGYDPIEKEKRWLSAMDIPDVDKLFPLVPAMDEDGNPKLNENGQPTGEMVLKFPPQPDPELEIKKADMQRRTLEGKVRGEIDYMKAESTIMVDQAKVMVMIAELEADEKAEENKVRIEELKLLVKEFEINRKVLVDMAKIENDKQRPNSGVG